MESIPLMQDALLQHVAYQAGIWTMWTGSAANTHPWRIWLDDW